MSKGPGRWQQRLLRAAGGAVIAPVGGVVRAYVVSPVRADYTSARRAARTMAEASRLAACYAWTCPGCFRVQDRPDPESCCRPARAMLAVANPGRVHLLAHPAPPPGGRPPSWLSDAPAPRPAPAGLAAVTLDDVAALALRRLWEALAAGTTPVVTARDVAALARLQLLIRQDERDRVRARSDEQWKLATKELLWIARGHLGDRWPDFVTDVRASQALRDLCGPPGRDSARTAPAR